MLLFAPLSRHILSIGRSRPLTFVANESLASSSDELHNPYTHVHTPISDTAVFRRRTLLALKSHS